MRFVPVLFLIAAELSGAAVRFDVVRDKSVIAVRTGKAGVLSAFGAGHAHGIVATDFSARVCADPETLRDAAVSVRVPTRSLRIDSADARQAAGLTDSGPKPADVQTIQQKMVSPANLASEQHPAIVFESTSVQQKDNTLVVQGALTIRGQSRPIAVPLRIAYNQKAYRLAGEFKIRLSEYGIRPESVGGVVKVADEVTVVMDLLTIPTRESCR